jgi:uncharacterized linocin/CFP29 family protein
MDEGCGQGGWTDAQWGRILAAVSEEASRARVAASVLPIYGPIAPGAQVVPADELTVAHDDRDGEPRLEVDDVKTVRIVTLQAEVSIKAAQMADPDIATALFLFRRTANLLARLEDALVFTGRPPAPRGGRNSFPDLFRVRGEVQWPGLLDAGRGTPDGVEGERRAANDGGRDDDSGPGQRLVTAIVDAISRLEGRGYGAPFVAVVGDGLFRDATTPNGSLVMPRDRIEPYLSGSLLRSSTIPEREGIVASLAGNPIDIALAQDMTAQFLQITREPRYLYRVYERLAVRVKDADAIVTLDLA